MKRNRVLSKMLSVRFSILVAFKLFYWCSYFSFFSKLCGFNQLIQKLNRHEVELEKSRVKKYQLGTHYNYFFRNIINSNCLIKSFTLKMICIDFGFNSKLKIGVRKSGKNFESHAWVEIEDFPEIEPKAEIETFKVIYQKSTNYERFPRNISAQ